MNNRHNGQNDKLNKRENFLSILIRATCLNRRHNPNQHTILTRKSLIQSIDIIQGHLVPLIRTWYFLNQETVIHNYLEVRKVFS